MPPRCMIARLRLECEMRFVILAFAGAIFCRNTFARRAPDAAPACIRLPLRKRKKRKQKTKNAGDAARGDAGERNAKEQMRKSGPGREAGTVEQMQGNGCGGRGGLAVAGEHHAAPARRKKRRLPRAGSAKEKTSGLSYTVSSGVNPISPYILRRVALSALASCHAHLATSLAILRGTAITPSPSATITSPG